MRIDREGATPRQGTIERMLYLPRVVTVAIGSSVDGKAVAASWIDLVAGTSQQWLSPTEPPLRTLALAMDELGLQTSEGDRVVEHDHPVTQSALELADLNYVQQLEQAGYRLRAHNQIDLWVLVDLIDSGADMDHAHHAQTVRAWLEAGMDALYAQTRLFMTMHLVLLCAPVAQAQAALWATCFETHCSSRVYVAGPINQAYLVHARWKQHASSAVTTLLWSDAVFEIAASMPARPGQWVRALGGATWLAPRMHLIHRLSLRWVKSLVAHLQSTTTSAPALTVQSLTEAMHELSRYVPPAVREFRRITRHPGWFVIGQLPHRLHQQIADEHKRRALIQEQSRRAWAQRRVEFFQAELAQQTDHALRPNQELPALAEACRQLRQSAAHLDAVVQQLAKASAAAEEVCLQNTVTVEAIFTELDHVCAQFPEPTLAGLWQAAKPWRWAKWAHLYAKDVDDLCRLALTKAADLQQAEWEHDNLRCLHRAFEQMSSATLKPLAQIEALWTRITTAGDLASTKMAHQELAALSPWDDTKLEALYTKYFGDGYILARDFFAEVNHTVWAQWESDALLEAWLGWAAPRLQPVAEWPALECLTAALPTEEELCCWCKAWVAQAAPLWPDEELLPAEVSGQSIFGLTPPEAPVMVPVQRSTMAEQVAMQIAGQVGIVQNDGRAAQLALYEARVREQLDGEQSPRWGETAVDGLLCLRWSTVDLSTEYAKSVQKRCNV